MRCESLYFFKKSFGIFPVASATKSQKTLYASSVRSIREANDLSADTIAADTMLLIPLT